MVTFLMFRCRLTLTWELRVLQWRNHSRNARPSHSRLLFSAKDSSGHVTETQARCRWLGSGTGAMGKYEFKVFRCILMTVLITHVGVGVGAVTLWKHFSVLWNSGLLACYGCDYILEINVDLCGFELG